jgi:hypothetical protein
VKCGCARTHFVACATITKQHRISYFLLCVSSVKLFTLVYNNIIGLFGSLMSEKAVEIALFSAFILLS